eukprot:31440-Pelagococcus_subviridis.AAC.30
MLSAHKEERVPKRQPKCVFACTTFLRLRTAYTLHTCTAVHRVRRVVGVCSLGYVVRDSIRTSGNRYLRSLLIILPEINFRKYGSSPELSKVLSINLRARAARPGQARRELDRECARRLEPRSGGPRPTYLCTCTVDNCHVQISSPTTVLRIRR